MSRALRDSVHPPLGTRTPARAEDFFDPTQLAELRAYSRPVKRVRLIARSIALVIDLVLIFGLDLGPRVADLVGGGWVVQLVLVGAVFAVIAAAIEAPFDYWASMVHDRRHGLSNRSSTLWAIDQVKELVFGVVVIVALLVPVYAVIRNVDVWWLLGGLVFLGISVIMTFVYPVVIMPRFNKFTPMPDGEVRTRIEEIAELAGVRIEGVYTMDGSKRSRRGNAFVAGFGPTKRVVVFDTMLGANDGVAFPLEQIAQVVAHEIGHYRLNHIPKTFPLAGLQMLASLAFVQYVGGLDTVLGWAGVDHLGDPGALPVFLLAFGISSAGFGVTTAWLSRRNEREADLEALELLANPTEFVAMWPSMVTLNKADLEPGWWDKLNASHPEVPERMQFALDWATMNGIDAQPPALAAVPEPADLVTE